MNTATGPPAGSRKRSGIGKTLFIAGLPAAQTLPAQLELKEALAKHLGRWATVKYVKLVHPRAVNARVKCAFASFHDTNYVLLKAHNSVLRGQVIKLEISRGDRTVRFRSPDGQVNVDAVNKNIPAVNGRIDLQSVGASNGFVSWSEDVTRRIAERFGTVEHVDERYLAIEQYSVLDVVMSSVSEAEKLVQALAQQDPSSGVIICWPHFSSQFVPTDTEPSSDRVTGAESVLQRVADAATEAHQMRRGPLTPAAFTANISANSSRASHTSSAIPSDPALPLGGVPESRSSSVNSHSVLSRAEKSRLRRQRKRMKQRQQAQQHDEHSSDADSSSKVSEYMSEDSSKAQEPSREREHTAVPDMSRAASSSELHIAQPMLMDKSQSSQGRPRTPSLHDSNEHREQTGEPDSSLSSMAVKTPPSITGAPTRPVQPTPLVNMPSTSASGLIGSLSADEVAFCPVSPSRSNDEDREQSIKKSVWVGSVPEHSTCEDLCEAFRDCGTVKTVTIRTSRVGQMAFIHFDTVETAERALQKDGLILDGVPLMVRPKTTRSSRSPSFAGPEYQPNIGNDSFRSQASQQAGLSFSNASALGLAQSLPPKPAEQVGGWLPHGSLPADQQKARNGRGKRPPMLKKAPSAKASPQQVQSRTRAMSNRDQYPAALAPTLNDTFTAYPNTATTNGATGGQTAVPFPAPWAFTYVGNQIVPILPPITPQFLPFNVVPPYLAHDQYLQGFTQAYGPYQGQSPYANTTPTPYSSAFAYSQPGPTEQTDFVNPLAFPIPQTNVEAKHTVSETEQARDRRLQQVATTIPHFRRTSSESALGSPFAPMPPKGYVIDGFAQDLVRGQPPRADHGPMMYPQLPPGFSMPSPQQWQHHGLVDTSFAFQYQEQGGADANSRARDAQARGPSTVEASPNARNRAQAPRSQINVPPFMADY